MHQHVRHEKYICFPSALPSKTAEGRPVDLLQPFVWLAWQRPLCQGKCGGASRPRSPLTFINNWDEPVAMGINAAFIQVALARRGLLDGRGRACILLSLTLLFENTLVSGALHEFCFVCMTMCLKCFINPFCEFLTASRHDKMWNPVAALTASRLLWPFFVPFRISQVAVRVFKESCHYVGK